MLRRIVEMQFEMKSGGAQAFGPWLAKQRANGASLRAIAQSVEKNTGIPVSHESVRQWLVEG
ncbi:MAG TPA: hypothetical protein VIG24_15085 [Acidimicrobiia bacterium]